MKDRCFLLKLQCFHFLFFLNRKLGMAGQKLGSSALLCYIRPDTADPTSSFSLTVANVGTCQAVLCRGGKPVPLSKVFSLEQDPEEAQRVKDQKAIITEVNLTFHQSFYSSNLMNAILHRTMKVCFLPIKPCKLYSIQIIVIEENLMSS